MEKIKTDFSKIKGWGIDTDPKNEPTYPIKHYTGDDHKRINWERPALQPVSVEVLVSTERPNVSAVYGSPNPPSGLSGVLRRNAFKYSENRLKHWLRLLIADRIDIVEGIFSDIFHGRVPRLAKERGWGALWKYAPGILIRKIIVRLLILTAVVTLIVYEYFYKTRN
ncbi:MAG: hypothetical protein ACJ77K_06275 [Bacteroidia bacterium]